MPGHVRLIEAASQIFFSSVVLSRRAEIFKKSAKNLKIGSFQPQPPLTPIGSGRDLHNLVEGTPHFDYVNIVHEAHGSVLAVSVPSSFGSDGSRFRRFAVRAVRGSGGSRWRPRAGRWGHSSIRLLG